MILEHGEELDSRQPVEGDPGSFTTHKTMSQSLLWWMTTSSLVNALLDGAGTNAFALVIGPRLVVEARTDGSLRSTRLRSFLQGEVGSVKISRTQMDAPLDENYESVHTLRSWDGTVMGTIGVDVGPPGRRWRFLDRGTYHLDLAVRTIAPTVIVDTAPDSLDWYARYEARRLLDGITLVLPHTHATEEYLRGLFGWVQQGRPPEEPFRYGLWTQDGRQSWEGARATSVAVTAEAEFGVTGLFKDDAWRDPSELEAARLFVQTRFDLRIGIWDLASNPALRESLLEPKVVESLPIAPASVPKGSAQRSAQKEAARLAGQRRRSEAHVAAREQFELLRPRGWEIETEEVDPEWGREPLYRFQLPLTQPVKRYEKSEPLAWLSVAIEARSTSVNIFVLIYNQFELAPYLASKQSLLERVAAPGECDLAERRPVLWRVAGGWRDDVDWNDRVAQFAAKTPLWLDAFVDLPAMLLDAYAKSFDQRGMPLFGPRARQTGLDGQPETH